MAVFNFCNIFIILSFLTFISCVGNNAPVKTKTGAGDQSQFVSTTSEANDYHRLVKRDGTAAGLISKENSIAGLSLILGQLNQEVGFGLGEWERRLTQYYRKRELETNVIDRLSDVMSNTAKEIKAIQKSCAGKLSAYNFESLKSELFLLDSYASQLSGKIKKARPLLK